MKNSFLLIFSFFLLTSSSVLGHNPSHSSTMLVEGKNNEWTLFISSALTAFQYEIKNKYTANSYKTPEEFKNLVVKHLLENISIICDDNKKIQLENLAVKLGHGTKVSFKVSGMPVSFNTISIKNTSFQNLTKSQSALIILKKGISKEQFILNETNNHTLKLNIKGSNFKHVVDTSFEDNNKGYLTWILSGLLVIIIIFFLRKKNQLINQE